MTTLIVYGKGDSTKMQVYKAIAASSVTAKTSVKMKSPRFWQYQPRFEIRLHDLTPKELTTLKVKLSFIHGISKTELI